MGIMSQGMDVSQLVCRAYEVVLRCLSWFSDHAVSATCSTVWHAVFHKCCVYLHMTVAAISLFVSENNVSKRVHASIACVTD